MKILVSVVRFRPRPPVSKGNRSRLPFPFSAFPHATCGCETDLRVLGSLQSGHRFWPNPAISILSCSQKAGLNHVDAGTRRSTFWDDTYGHSPTADGREPWRWASRRTLVRGFRNFCRVLGCPARLLSPPEGQIGPHFTEAADLALLLVGPNSLHSLSNKV